MKILTEQKLLPQNTPKQIIIFLHGYGSNGANLIDLASYFRQEIPDTAFFAPNAPFETGSFDGYQWFSLENRNENNMYNGLQNVSPILIEYIETKLKETNLTADKVFLFGFSQGSMLSMHLAYRWEKQIAGIMCFSGILIKPSSLDSELVHKVPTLLAHGDQDDVVPYISMENANSKLQSLNIPTICCTEYGAKHSIAENGIIQAIEFIKNNLKK